MFAILYALGMFAANLFKSRIWLEAENLFLRHQLNIALRRAPPRLRLRGSDRALLIWMTKLWPSLLSATLVVQPETILRWNRAVCVPKTSSVSRTNRLTSAHHDRAAVFRNGHLGRAIQVEDPA